MVVFFDPDDTALSRNLAEVLCEDASHHSFSLGLKP
jgi:hypothetical protein